MTQSFANHAHRPWLTVAAFGFWLLAIAGIVAAARGNGWGVTAAAAGLLLAVLCLILISRAYTVRLQDRIIHLEERLRAERLLAPAQLARWDQLDTSQVVALRFASDAEFASLFDRALAERLPPRAIKQAIAAWRPDHRRT